MRKTVSDLKQHVSAILTGLDLDTVPDLYGSFERAVATTIQKADVPETMLRQPIMLYSGVYYYPPDTRMFGTALIDVRPQGNTPNWGQTYKRPIADFSQLRRQLPYGFTVDFEYHNGDPIMGIIQGRTLQQVNLSPMTSSTGFSIGGNASGLAVDYTVYYQQPASLRFNLAAAGTQGTLSTTLTNGLDLTRYQGVGVAFLAAYFPTSSAITSVELRLGSDSANYYSVTVTAGFVGEFWSNEWFLLAFDLASATTVGTPNIAALDYINVLTNYTSTAALPNVRYGGLWMSLPSPFEMFFYSAAAFRAGSTGNFSVTIASDNDEIIFRDAAYNIYVQEAAREVAKNQGAQAGSGTILQIDEVLEGAGSKVGLYGQYRGDNPSEELRSVGNYYDDGYSNYGGGVQ